MKQSYASHLSSGGKRKSKAATGGSVEETNSKEEGRRRREGCESRKAARWWLLSTALVAEHSGSGRSLVNPRGFLSRHREISTCGGGLG
ncbi:unnamed protein product [Lactuca virosa]|uniref:Uncharacterized protein n=1 Tax=Lactuca virosa TaxID=75947 RepID=A0AAU9NQ65_9ASTR|nr:unnamed protein product [Lactuca virosa]